MMKTVKELEEMRRDLPLGDFSGRGIFDALIGITEHLEDHVPMCTCPIFVPGSSDINNRIRCSEIHHAEPYGQPPWKFCPWCGGSVWPSVTGVTPSDHFVDANKKIVPVQYRRGVILPRKLEEED